MKELFLKNKNKIHFCLEILMAYLSTFGLSSMLKVPNNTYFISNSIFSFIIFIALIYLYKKIYSKQINKRLITISLIYGFFFSVFLNFGASIIREDFDAMLTLKGIIKILCGTPLMTTLTIILFEGIEFITSELNGNMSITKRSFIHISSSKIKFLIVWILIFLAWLPGLIASYPGIFGYDGIYQLKYYYTNMVCTHHPVIHTYLLGFCIWTLGNLFGNLQIGLFIYSIIQMIILSFAFTFVVKYVGEKSNEIIQIITLLLLMFLPTNAIMSFSTTKDIIYTAFFALMVLMMLKIVEKPELLKNYKYVILLILVSFMQIIFRSAGKYVFIFMMICAFIFLKKYWKNLLIILIVVLSLNFIYTGPIYKALNVIQEDSIHEMMSVPASQLARAYIDNDYELTEEQKKEIENYIPDCKNYYTDCAISDNVKNNFNSEYFKENPINFFKLWINVGKIAPKTYIKAFTRLTIGLWYPDMNYRDKQAYHPYWEYLSLRRNGKLYYNKPYNS